MLAKSADCQSSRNPCKPRRDDLNVKALRGGPRKAELLFGEKEAQRSQTGFAHLCVKPQSGACADVVSNRAFKVITTQKYEVYFVTPSLRGLRLRIP